MALTIAGGSFVNLSADGTIDFNEGCRSKWDLGVVDISMGIVSSSFLSSPRLSSGCFLCFLNRISGVESFSSSCAFRFLADCSSEAAPVLR